MPKQAAYQTRYHNRLSIYIVLCFLFVFAVVLTINCRTLSEKVADLESEQIVKAAELEKEQQYTMELQELEKSLQTKESYAQIARERLGMVFKDEIVFKTDD